MKLQIEIEIEPFPVPDFVSKKTVVANDPPNARTGLMSEGPMSIPLENVDAETLSQLCEAFTAAVFAKAQKEPRR